MPSKRNARTRAVSPIEDDDDDILLSQYSRALSSEDHELELYAKAAAEFKVSWQKHKQEKENNFLQTARVELNEFVHGKQSEVEGIVARIEQVFQKFLAKKVDLDEKKRAVIAAIIEKHGTLVSFSIKRHQDMIERGQDVEEGQCEGMNQVKQSCKDFAEFKNILLGL